MDITAILRVTYRVGHTFGVEKLADYLFQSRAVVYNKLNPDNDSNHLYLRDAIALTDKSNDDSILQEWAHQRGYLLVKVPDSVCCDEDLSDQLMKLSEQMGVAMGEVRQARADGVIDPDEFDRVRAGIKGLIKEAMALKHVIGSQVRELPGNNAA